MVVLALGACGSESTSIRVDLRTDFVPGIEFTDVRTTVVDVSETTRLSRDDDAFEPTRVATLDDVPRGNQIVAVELLDASGELVAERAVRVRLREDLGVTVLITRDCRGVMCPGAGDDPNALTCLGGRCVPLDCTDGTSPECPDPECESAAECVDGSACSSAQCLDGACVYRRDDAMCDAEQYCEPERGCLDVPDLPDAGMVDASMDDASMPLQVLDVRPHAGPTAGGTLLTFTLEGNRDGLMVMIGGAPCGMIDPVAGTCVTMPGSVGTLDVNVIGARGATTLPSAFTYFADGPYQIGTAQDDNSSGIDVDSTGAIYVSGGSLGDIDGPNQGDWDALLVKLRPDGSMEWARTIATPLYDYARDVIVGADDTIYLGGYTNGDLDGANAGGTDVFVAAFETNGDVRWVRQHGSAGNEECWDLGVDDEGNVFLAGRSDGSVGSGNAGGLDVVLWKFDPDGLDWVRQFGSAVDDWGHSVGVDPAGHAFLVGYTLGVLDGSSNQGDRDLFVARFDADGNNPWIQQRGGAGRDEALDAIVASTGEVYVSGRTSDTLDGESSAGGDDVFLMRWGPDGTWRWTRQWGAAGNQVTFGLSEDREGNLYVPGNTPNGFDGETVTGGTDIFLSKLDTSGNRLWTRIRGTTGSDNASSCVADVGYSEMVYVSVITDAMLGPTTAGMNDVAVIKVDVDGIVR